MAALGAHQPRRGAQFGHQAVKERLDFGHLPGGTDTETFTRTMDAWPVDAIGLRRKIAGRLLDAERYLV